MFDLWLKYDITCRSAGIFVMFCNMMIYFTREKEKLAFLCKYIIRRTLRYSLHLSPALSLKF